MEKEWFAEWFDSPYYHILYKSRDEQEARNTLDQLLRALDLPPGAAILDLACGKGRHARYLAEKGFRVTGIDISESSIIQAREFEHAQLEFYQHDMRKPFRNNYFDAVMNMFTSFGYFETEREHLTAMQHIARNLRPGGLFLLDYFNSVWVASQLVTQDEKTIDGITFHLKRSISNGYVLKTIDFQANGRHLEFTEAVRLFSLEDFIRLFEQSGLQLKRIFGGYALEEYKESSSKRLILVAEKTQ